MESGRVLYNLVYRVEQKYFEPESGSRLYVRPLRLTYSRELTPAFFAEPAVTMKLVSTGAYGAVGLIQSFWEPSLVSKRCRRYETV